MKLQERSYSSKIVRPKPLIHIEEDGSLIVVVTAWGEPEHGERALNEVVKYVGAAKADVEVTSPFEFLTCISDEANYVRTALMIANDALYRGENRKEYSSGVEVLAIFKRGSQVAWAQVGAPSILVQRQNQSMQPLSIASDLVSEMRDTMNLPPLPAQLLGLDPTCNIQTGHTHVNEGDKLVLFAGTALAPSVWGLQSYEMDLNMITNAMIQQEPELPFWLGLIAI